MGSSYRTLVFLNLVRGSDGRHDPATGTLLQTVMKCKQYSLREPREEEEDAGATGRIRRGFPGDNATVSVAVGA
jgi:hypothetical protein